MTEDHRYPEECVIDTIRRIAKIELDILFSLEERERETYKNSDRRTDTVE